MCSKAPLQPAYTPPDCLLPPCSPDKVSSSLILKLWEALGSPSLQTGVHRTDLQVSSESQIWCQWLPHYILRHNHSAAWHPDIEQSLCPERALTTHTRTHKSYLTLHLASITGKKQPPYVESTRSKGVILTQNLCMEPLSPSLLNIIQDQFKAAIFQITNPYVSVKLSGEVTTLRKAQGKY